MLADLYHPNIPKVTDFFIETGKYYLVMEFVSGETLESRLARQAGPIGEAEARDWALQLCDVLTYLHSRNPPVIFRDLKPANIMLTPQGHIKLVDFGIAPAVQPGEGRGYTGDRHAGLRAAGAVRQGTDGRSLRHLQPGRRAAYPVDPSRGGS